MSARHAVAAIINDLCDRKGLSQEWDQIDESVKDEIKMTWTRYVEKEIAAARDRVLRA